MASERYQQLPRAIRAWRWLKYRPSSIAHFAIWLVGWSVRGCPGRDAEFTLGALIRQAWTYHASDAAFCMGRWYTTEELLASLTEV